MKNFEKVAPASCRLSRGHLALGSGRKKRLHDSRQNGVATKSIEVPYP
jgi:hypothetical protein